MKVHEKQGYCAKDLDFTDLRKHSCTHIIPAEKQQQHFIWPWFPIAMSTSMVRFGQPSLPNAGDEVGFLYQHQQDANTEPVQQTSPPLLVERSLQRETEALYLSSSAPPEPELNTAAESESAIDILSEFLDFGEPIDFAGVDPKHLAGNIFDILRKKCHICESLQMGLIDTDLAQHTRTKDPYVSLITHYNDVLSPGQFVDFDAGRMRMEALTHRKILISCKRCSPGTAGAATVPQRL